MTQLVTSDEEVLVMALTLVRCEELGYDLNAAEAALLACIRGHIRTALAEQWVEFAPQAQRRPS
jgi:hypothetical protein